MKFLSAYLYKMGLAGLLLCLTGQSLFSQTDVDAIMLKKKIFCVGGMFSTNSWTNYWEGTFKRDNENLGKVTTNMYTVMGNYGLTDKINLLFSLPYVTTKASAGTLSGLEGFQDLALGVKWNAFTWKMGSEDKLSVYGAGRVSLPVSNYVADFLPLSIGMRSKTAGIRLLVDYQLNKFFATASAGYIFRSNVEIDRNAYFDTEMHYTNKVDMPDQFNYNVSLGYRSKNWIASFVIENMTTLGGFDIRKNDMPFPSNNMDMTQGGLHVKHTLKKVRGLELVAGGRYVLDYLKVGRATWIMPRNVGQATTIYGGVFYLLDLAGKRKIRNNQ